MTWMPKFFLFFFCDVLVFSFYFWRNLAKELIVQYIVIFNDEFVGKITYITEFRFDMTTSETVFIYIYPTPPYNAIHG